MLGLWLNITTHKMILLPYLLFFFYVHNVISLLIIVFFRLPCPPLAKRGSLTHSQALALSKRARDVTAPPVALNRCALRLAGHQSPRQDCFSGDEPAGENLLKLLGGMGPQGDGKKYKFFYYSDRYLTIQGFNSGMSTSIVSQRLSGSIV